MLSFGGVHGSLAAAVYSTRCDVSPACTCFQLSLWPHGEGICSNPNTDRTVFVDLQKSITRALLGCDHVSQNAMTAACACWPPSPDKPVKKIHLFGTWFSEVLKYMLQVFFLPLRLLACLKLGVCLKCSPECTAKKWWGQRVLLLCSASWYAGYRIEAPNIKNVFIYLFGSPQYRSPSPRVWDDSLSFCRKVGCARSTEYSSCLALARWMDECALLQGVGQGVSVPISRTLANISSEFTVWFFSPWRIVKAKMSTMLHVSECLDVCSLMLYRIHLTCLPLTWFPSSWGLSSLVQACTCVSVYHVCAPELHGWEQDEYLVCYIL